MLGNIQSKLNVFAILAGVPQLHSKKFEMNENPNLILSENISGQETLVWLILCCTQSYEDWEEHIYPT